MVNGKPVGLLTGTDVEEMKNRLFYGYFHLPDPNKVHKPRGLKRKRGKGS